MLGILKRNCQLELDIIYTGNSETEEGPPANLHYDLPVTLKDGKKERQDWF
jgi:hypothetical protein